MNRICVSTVFSGICYAAIQTETGFLFHYCSSPKGFDEREFQRAVTEPGPKDIAVNDDQILEKNLNVFSPAERAHYGCCAGVTLRTAEKTYRFRVDGKHGETELRKFFRLSDGEIHLPEPLPEPVDLPARNEKDEAKYTALFILCAALDLAVLVCAAVLPYRPWLILGLTALVLPVVLVLVHPEWYTLIHDTGNPAVFNGKRMLPAMFLLFIPAWLLALRLPQITYLSSLRAYIICALPMLALAVTVWLLSRERSRAPALLALVLAGWMLMGLGVGHAVNALDYYYSPPTLTEHLRITALEKRSSTNCLVTVGGGGEELVFNVDREYYETLSVGGTVTVDYFDGALGAAFADIREPWE